ncbi:MAG TPA: recombination mediator RecR [Bacteroidales bacterium]|jgi:recombination protein RecR|nr:recombination mediator RecR [Bacteroidales bacterium]
MNFSYPSRLLEEAVNEFATLPGIGQKTALRLVLHLIKQNRLQLESFGNSIIKLGTDLKFCSRCHNISDEDLCGVCNDKRRDQSIICVVESIKDVMIIENTQQYRGVYHVLGGIISPMDGLGPSDLNINSLEERVKQGGINEIILALSATMEGDTTNFYLYRRLNHYNINFSTLARGVSIGDELEYTDEVTLGRSLVNRIPFTVSS